MQQNKFCNTVYSIQSFLEVDIIDWGTRLKEHHLDCLNEKASYAQRKAWVDCFHILRNQLAYLNLPSEILSHSYIIFEYELPRERGRRPDVLILSGHNLIVLEFKGHTKEDQAHIDQTKHYARDLRSYHEQSHQLNVHPILVLAGGKNISRKIDHIQIASGDKLHELLHPLIQHGFKEIKTWFYSDYSPLPSLIHSAQLLFKGNSFPQIKKAKSAGIPKVIDKLKQIAQQAKDEKSHHLTLITGVPGAGKTLVGLQLVFETDMLNNQQKAIFLSGNRPLVEVLQFSLGNKHFVKGVHDFLKEYSQSDKLPSEDIFIYDEAQRAWDKEKASAQRPENNAEPTDFINIGDKKSHCLLIGLVGEGQEIHLGEESGLKLWTDALKQSEQGWKVHCPEKLTAYFNNSPIEVTDEFNLTNSLRTHQAVQLQKWVENLLDNKIQEAKNLMHHLFENDYAVYVTRDFTKASTYVNEKYANEPDKTYGIVASSKSMLLPTYGIKNDFNSTRAVSIARYYVDKAYSKYCRQLNSVVTEFACQGLELDLPILAWEADWIYDNGWKDKKPNKKAKDSFNLRKNSYRVLLTRGRDGLVIYVPNHPKLEKTYNILIEAGCKGLPNNL